MEWVILVFKNENTTGKHADKNGFWAYHVLISIICITKQTQYTQFTHKHSNMQTRQLQVGVHLNLNGKMESKLCGVSCVCSCIKVLRIFVNRLRWFRVFCRFHVHSSSSTFLTTVSRFLHVKREDWYSIICYACIECCHSFFPTYFALFFLTLSYFAAYWIIGLTSTLIFRKKNVMNEK